MIWNLGSTGFGSCKFADASNHNKNYEKLRSHIASFFLNYRHDIPEGFYRNKNSAFSRHDAAFFNSLHEANNIHIQRH